ncbi:MAG TPA: methyltransferase domain-containing protein [Saprospiraceae bacterium]|nr:methyltransferase domain-containing protein [Saprospiraceae bacterium]HPG06174.1 methyltransferase domain-containing protein [Saprospiraceae bacterium]HPQ98013.1 methyltransferase domain-containing protein [Saprospiraceae bacterium]HRV86223.1 methyltransferase domain-containing protein [Saprospiraceae bacterium]
MDQYIHGYEAEEQKRLAQLNDLLNHRCLTKMRLEKGQKVLDVGSGLGMFSRMMADAVGPSGMVVGIEKSEEQLTQASQWSSGIDHLQFRQGDAYSLPLERKEVGFYDVTHTRFLLEHVRTPLQVVRELFRATKPGGRILLLDDDHLRFTLYPELPAFDSIWSAYLGSYEVLGNDPYVGRKLVGLLADAGCGKIHNDFVFFGSNAREPEFHFYVQNLCAIIEQARPVILSHELLEEALLDQGLKALQNWQMHPHATIWYQICWAEGIKPE